MDLKKLQKSRSDHNIINCFFQDSNKENKTKICLN